ncbi:hypothetical protein U1Q18_031319 [Sarracenia purpurea var. burkii]
MAGPAPPSRVALNQPRAPIGTGEGKSIFSGASSDSSGPNDDSESEGEKEDTQSQATERVVDEGWAKVGKGKGKDPGEQPVSHALDFPSSSNPILSKGDGQNFEIAEKGKEI